MVFKSCGGILELRREIQASSCVGPGKSSQRAGNPACRGTFGGRRKAVRDRFALQGPWTARRANQSILKEINPGIEPGAPALGWGQKEKGMTEDEMAGWRH